MGKHQWLAANWPIVLRGYDYCLTSRVFSFNYFQVWQIQRTPRAWRHRLGRAALAAILLVVFVARDFKVFQIGAEIAECRREAQRFSHFLLSLRHRSKMNMDNCRETAVTRMAKNTSSQRQRNIGDGDSSSVVEWIEETAGVWLAAVFTVIAGAGTILQVVAFFR
ncbi:hypothetical protein [Paraburkholderia sp. PGU19]|uniref:hypothetical protein n=1 Tax=Paraburkholderia sp. PGU19 TaxID=2735434 RepID=UPI0015DA9756|nr:hypothetical protein [Paraburkholderia sp. PGU19]